jgi:hypothetical protein
MTPEEHYAAAEQLLRTADNLDGPVEDTVYLIALAQVHATLATARRASE